MKVLIIGGVAAGMSAASKIRRERPDAKVIVLERGGETSYGACGLPYYVSGVNPDENKLRIRSAAEFVKSGIDLRLFHEATAVDFDNKTVTVKDLNQGNTYTETYDELVIACGADAIKPPIPGISLPGIYTLKSIPDANLLKNALTPDIKKVAVVGGGYIGLEMVESLLHLGKEVVLFEMADRLLLNFDPEISQPVLAHLKEKGVDVRLNEGVLEFSGSDQLQAITTTKGTYPVDLAVFAIGVRPNTGFITDERLKKLKNGAIVVDPFMRASLPHVYAAGDCATVRHMVTGEDVFIALGTNANKQGRYLAETICGAPHAYQTALGTAMIKVCDLELGRTGLTEQEAQAAGIPCATSLVTGANHAPYYPNQEAVTVKLVYRKENYQLLGAQLVGGPGTALRTNVLAVCLSQKMDAREIGELDLGYAPPFAMPWDVLHIAANVIK